MKHLELSYEKLNDLLDECFWSERRYFNAAEDIQKTEWKRFLSHESVNRNRYCNHIITALDQEEQEVDRLDVIKGFPNRDWHDVKAALVNPQADHLIEECIKQDIIVLELVKVIIEDGWLPTHILEIMVPMEFQIKQSHIDLETLKLKLNNKNQQEEKLQTIDVSKTSESA